MSDILTFIRLTCVAQKKKRKKTDLCPFFSQKKKRNLWPFSTKKKNVCPFSAKKKMYPSEIYSCYSRKKKKKSIPAIIIVLKILVNVRSVHTVPRIFCTCSVVPKLCRCGARLGLSQVSSGARRADKSGSVVLEQVCLT